MLEFIAHLAYLDLRLGHDGYRSLGILKGCIDMVDLVDISAVVDVVLCDHRRHHADLRSFKQLLVPLEIEGLFIHLAI